MSDRNTIIDQIRELVNTEELNLATILQVEQLLVQLKYVISAKVVRRPNNVRNALSQREDLPLMCYRADNNQYFIVNPSEQQRRSIMDEVEYQFGPSHIVQTERRVIIGVTTAGYIIPGTVWDALEWIPSPSEGLATMITVKPEPFIYDCNNEFYAILGDPTFISADMNRRLLNLGATYRTNIWYYGVMTTGWIFPKHQLNAVLDQLFTVD